jgi:hypothetical protein
VADRWHDPLQDAPLEALHGGLHNAQRIRLADAFQPAHDGRDVHDGQRRAVRLAPQQALQDIALVELERTAPCIGGPARPDAPGRFTFRYVARDLADPGARATFRP